jgi:thiol-disulfide isomerase/thioredoxin
MFKKFLIRLMVLFTGVLFFSCESNDGILFPVIDPGSVPVLLVPSNNSTLSTTAPEFEWTQIQNTLTYRFQLSSDAQFSNLISDTSGLNSPAFSFTEILNDSSSYYWRVNAFLSTGDTSQWSNSFSFSVVLSSISPTKKVLIELFTNTSCIPCVETNHYLDEVHDRLGITVNDADVIILRMHTTLFSGDPFYEFNPGDNAARMNYYNAASVNPRGFILGSTLGPYSTSGWTNRINGQLGNFRTFAIVLENSYNASGRNGNISIKVKQESGNNISDLVLHVAIAESGILYNAPNGETRFENTLRDLVTSASGQPVTISAGQTNTYDMNYSLDPVINENQTDVIVFVQSVSTKEVFAVEKVKIN